MIPSFSHKLVAVMNEKIEPGIGMNALAHLCLGFGAFLGAGPLRLANYQDQDGNSHSHISEMPFIILKGNSTKLRALRQAAKEAQLAYSDFTDTMTVGTYIEQLERTKQTKEIDLIYYGVVLYGEWELVTQLTKKFSLWK